MAYHLLQDYATGRTRPNGRPERQFLDPDDGEYNLVRIAPNKAIVWTRDALATKRTKLLATLAEDGRERLSLATRQHILDVHGDRTFTAAHDLRAIIADVLLRPAPGVGIGPLVPQHDGRQVIWLGPGAHFSPERAFWSRDDEPDGPHSQDIQDLFTRTATLNGSTSSDGQFTWAVTLFGNGVAATATNVVQFTVATSGDDFMICVPSKLMDTVNHYGQFDLVSWAGIQGMTAEVVCRLQAASGGEGYSFYVGRQFGPASPSRAIYDWSGANIASDTTATTSGTLHHEWNGSTYVAKVDGVTIFSGTDTLYNTYRNTAMCAYVGGIAPAMATHDNFRAADVGLILEEIGMPVRGMPYSEPVVTVFN